MNNLILNAKNFLIRVKGLFPSALPRGLTEFNTWSDNIISAYPHVAPGVPTADLKATLATMIMGLKSTESHASMRFFAKCLHKGASNQVASQVFYDYKQAQKAEAAAKAASA